MIDRRLIGRLTAWNDGAGSLRSKHMNLNKQDYKGAFVFYITSCTRGSISTLLFVLGRYLRPTLKQVQFEPLRKDRRIRMRLF